MSFVSDMFGGENKYDDDVKRAQQAAFDEINGIGAFDASQLQISPDELAKYKATQGYTAAQETPSEGYESSLSDVSVDPRLRQAQEQALQALQEQGASGLTPQDKATLARMQSARSADIGAREGAIMQQMAARGGYSPGMELAARLQAQQSGADRAMQEDLDVAGKSFGAKQAALAAAGALGGQMESEQFGQEARIADAKDVARRFGIDTSTGQQSRNIATQNAAIQRAWDTGAEADKLNTGTDINRVQSNKAATRTAYDMQVEAAQRRAANQSNKAAASQAQADRKRKAAGAVLQLGTQIVGSAVEAGKSAGKTAATGGIG